MRKLSSSGFGLLETIAALGVMGVVMGMMGTMIFNMSKSQKTVETRQNIGTLAFEVQALFSTDMSCPRVIESNQPFDEAKAKLSTIEGQPIYLMLNGERIQGGSDSPKYGLKVEHIYLNNAQGIGSDASGNEVFSVHVMGIFKGIGTQSPDFAARILATPFFKVNGGRIVGCMAATSSQLSTIIRTPAANPEPSPPPSFNLPAGYGGVGTNCGGREHGEIWLNYNNNDKNDENGGFQLMKCMNGAVTSLIQYND